MSSKRKSNRATGKAAVAILSQPLDGVILIAAALAAAVFLLISARVSAGRTALLTVESTVALFGLFFLYQNYDSTIKKYPYINVWISGALSMLGLVMIYTALGIYPFGELSSAAVDMPHQYIPFYGSLRQRIASGDSLIYSTELGLGGSYWALCCYYLFNPVALVSLLCSRSALPDLMTAAELAKIFLMGSSFALFSGRKFKRNDGSVIILSLCYSMMSFFIMHMCTIVWTDCFILLPVALLGIDDMFESKKPWLYMLSLAGMWLTNYYIAYIISLYLALYCVVMLIIANGGVKESLKKFGKFFGISVASVGMSAVTLIPSAFAVAETAAADDKLSSGFFAADIVRLIPQLLYSSETTILSEDSQPIIYCSMLALLLLPIFFAVKGISVRVKAAWGGLAAFMLLSIFTTPLSFVWHAFHIPNHLPHRMAFLFVTTVLIIAGYTLEHIDEILTNAFTYSFLGIMAAAFICFMVGGMDNTAMLIGSCLLAAGYTVIFALSAEKKISSGAAVFMAAMLIFSELTASGLNVLNVLSKESKFVSRSEYNENIERSAAALAAVPVSDSDICRTELLCRNYFNENVMLGNSGFSYFSSTATDNILHTMGQIGYNSDRRTTYLYKSFTPMMDSALNLKYLVYDYDAGQPPYLEYVGESDGLFIYSNSLVLPRGYAVSEELLDWNIEQNDPFEVQNEFLRRAANIEGDVYVNIPLGTSASSMNDLSEGKVKFGKSGGIFNAVSEKFVSREHVYIYINCSGAAAVNVSVGDRHYSIDPKDTYIADLGFCEKGECVGMIVTSENEIEGSIYLARLDEAALTEGLARLGENVAEFGEYTDTHIECSIDSEGGELLFLSIPYEKGWSATRNGQPVDIVSVGGFIGIPLEDGEALIELHYRARGLAAGAFISLGFAAALLLMIFRPRLLKKK